MNHQDIIRMAREACDQAPREDWNSNAWVFGDETLERFAALVAATERNKLAAWMMSQGYATGHGDTVEDLLQELDWQIREQERKRIESRPWGAGKEWIARAIEAEREACAKVCDGMDHNGVMIAADCAAAIRARGNGETHR